MNVERLELVAKYPDGGESAPFRYDIAIREALDAVVMVAHYRHKTSGKRHVFLRSAARPPAALRPIAPAHDGLLWEVAAGLIEPGETPEQAASRELWEELGVRVNPDALMPLGHWAFPAPALIGERHLFFHVEVNPAERVAPTEDGSALEQGARILDLPLADALEACRAGFIRDAKTELALRRLADLS